MASAAAEQNNALLDPRRLEYQMRVLEQPGHAMTVACRGELLLEHAIGVADQKLNIPLTPRHRFRVESHSKSFAAAGLLHEQKRVALEDRWGSMSPVCIRTWRRPRSHSYCRTRLASAATVWKRPTG
jgi:CubicO group peptidase (beta-lactamase class C family)